MELLEIYPENLGWEELLEMAVRAAVPAVIASVAWRNRVKRPVAARLFLAAAILQLLPIGIGAAKELLGLHDMFDVLEASVPDTLPAVSVGDELHPGSPGWQRMIAQQFAFSVFDIAAWSLMAWAILMRPDEPRQDRSQERIADIIT